MNVVFLSPHFPPNFRFFCTALRRLGANTLGVADASFDYLAPDLRAALTEYYRVERMEHYDQVLRALGYFTHRYGKIDRVDSHNEHWLELEARLRTDFNIQGIGLGTIAGIKFKSRMKSKFAAAGVASPRGEVVADRSAAETFIERIGYPVVAKPDKGVGASATFKVSDRRSLDHFLAEKPPGVDYFMEEFIDGTIETFDGLTDRDGTCVFHTSHVYDSGVMEVVNEDWHIAYWSRRSIPDDLRHAGLALLRVYDVRERFFHFEFFRRRSDGTLLALEVNMRPPGGPTMDMFNYANDIDLYQEWANIVVRNEFTATDYDRPFHACFIGRKRWIPYIHPHAAVVQRLGTMLSQHVELPKVFTRAMGDEGYLIRSADFEAIRQAIAFVHAHHPVPRHLSG